MTTAVAAPFRFFSLRVVTTRRLGPSLVRVTFGGPDLRTVYIGSLKGKRIPCFRAPIAGLPMVHWHERQ